MGVADFIISSLSKVIFDAISNADFSKITTRSISRKECIDRLIDAYKKEDLVLVLGSGVSVPYNLPDWKTLLQRLLLASISKEGETKKDDAKLITTENNEEVAEDASKVILSELFSRVGEVSPLVAARFLSGQYNRSTTSKRNTNSGTRIFEDQVRELLYASLKSEEDGEEYDSELMKEIRQLCIAVGKSPNLDSIITYNFDDVLEECLKKLNIDIPFKAIYETGVRPEQGKLSIYHVHGYLPRKGNLDQGHRVIFSENIYHKQYVDIYSWSNIVQINKFREKVCLFIGVSFSDPNMRRLLDIAQEQRGEQSIQHFAIKKREDLNDVVKAVQLIIDRDQILSSQLRENKIDLPKLIVDLRRLKEDFEEQDAYSFGVGTIWINDFKEIQDIVYHVRQMDRYRNEEKV